MARIDHVGGTDPLEARRLADAEAAGGGVPDGCAWLNSRTVGDLDLPLVLQTVDRTTTPTGAQVLWRWLAAPALDIDVLEERERKLACVAADPDLPRRVRTALGPTAVMNEAQYLPRLLWEAAPPPMTMRWFVVSLVALASLLVLGVWFPIVWIAAVLLFYANVMLDDWANLKLAHQARALEVLERTLAAAHRVRDRLPALLAGNIGDELAEVASLRRRTAVLAIKDPFDILDLLRAGFLVRLLVLSRCIALIERERERLQRIVLWVGELDALVSIATLRSERSDCRVPELAETAARIDARDLVHPAIENAVGNDLALDGTSLLITGSNMSGKSTFLRTICVNAICAQSIHTTFGGWRASVFRVHAVMRTVDDTAGGVSTYAVEVVANGALVAATSEDDDDIPALFAIDEPFSGTNPAMRVPIVVAVLDYLAARDIAIAATHDLDVAAMVSPQFLRGHFLELDDEAGTFDRKLRPGVAPSSNALALLERAGYPEKIIADAKRIGLPTRLTAT